MQQMRIEHFTKPLRKKHGRTETVITYQIKINNVRKSNMQSKITQPLRPNMVELRRSKKIQKKNRINNTKIPWRNIFYTHDNPTRGPRQKKCRLKGNTWEIKI